MRYYAWYSAEINVIILQIMLENCTITFEWDWVDMYEHLDYDKGIDADAYSWMPLGEL